MSWGWRWKPYVPVAKRRATAQKYAEKLKKKGRQIQPVEIEGRTIARTFWGKAWCDNLESYSDFENRLPRGRTYVRNGSVVDLQITSRRVTAIVSGSEIYDVTVEIAALAKSDWKKITADCSRTIDSLMDLLEGRLSGGVMERLTRQKEGLFPQPKEIKMQCSCPDWATLCKHVAAVLYGVGARLDLEPQLLFLLRDVNHLELIEQAVDGASLDAALSSNGDGSLADEDLGELFGIELDGDAPADAGDVTAEVNGTATRSRRKRTARSPATVKQQAAARSKNKTPGRKRATASKGKSQPVSATGKKSAGKKAGSKTSRGAKQKISTKKKVGGKKKPASSGRRKATKAKAAGRRTN